MNVCVAYAGGRITSNRLNGNLAITRAFGDNDIGEGLSFVPDVYWFTTPPALVLYSDGMYEPAKVGGRGVAPANFRDEYLYQIAVDHGPDELGSEDNLTALVWRHGAQ